MPDGETGRHGGPFFYRDDVLRELARHGVQPTADTPPDRVREFVRELYKFEIRRLRDRMVRQEFPRTEYAGRVDALRRRYPVLSLHPQQFLSGPTTPLAGPG